MTVKLSEGCWGVTRGGEKPFKLREFGFPPAETEIRYVIEAGGGSGWREDGTAVNRHHEDIIEVFATEAEADAYLAGETDPVAAEIQRDMLAHSDFRAPPAPKPVTWPDGVTKMTIGPHQITIDAETGVIQVVWHGSVGSTPAQARQLAALLLAAADKVEGRG